MLYGFHGVKGVTRQMEDAILAIPSLRSINSNLQVEIGLFGILDGHGGRDIVEFVEANLPIEIANQLTLFNGSIDFIIKKACNQAWKIIDDRIVNEMPEARDGCTALIALVTQEYFYTVNMGDSAAYLCRVVNSIVHSIPLNDVHKTWVNSEKERIISMGGSIEGGRVNGILPVTRSFGDLHLKRFGVISTANYKKARIDLTLDKFVILACDGFWNSVGSLDACNKTMQYIKDIEKSSFDGINDKTNKLDRVCARLVDLALSNKSQENICVVLITI